MRYCFDLDGTLCTNAWPEYEKAQPFLDRIEKVNALYEQGHYIIIDTARGSSSGKDLLDLTKKQLRFWSVKYHELRVGKKPAADIYIDDKGINEKDFFKNKLNNE
jgi:hydroxymethylpyrimidine pyrophosphatase-like HAD family hydrolase